MKSFEKDETSQLVLLNRLLKIKRGPQVPQALNSTPVIHDSSSEQSKSSNFGNVLFPQVSNKSRDVNKWPLVLGRTFRGTSDDTSVSKFCTLLISYGIKESASAVEFFRYILYNLSPEINVEVVNFLISKGCIEDQCASHRLSVLYNYLKSKYAITDNPSILYSKLECMKQESRSVADFAADFRIKVEELRVSQASVPLAESHILSVFKRSLHEAYRRCADEHFEITTLDRMIDALMLWERNFALREGHMPNTKTISKVKLTVAQRMKCPFCKKCFHSESKCWEKYPELKPRKCTDCSKSHLGKCRVDAPDEAQSSSKFRCSDDTKLVKSAIVSIDTTSCNLLSTSKPWVVRLEHYDLSVPLDTCASCSMMSPSKALEILDAYEDAELRELLYPFPVEFGNSTKVQASQTVLLKHCFNDDILEFLIIPHLSVPILIGHSDIIKFCLLQQNNLKVSVDHLSPPSNFLTTSVSDAPDIQLTQNDKGNIVVRCPMFENANVLPWREKARSHSEVESQIIDKLLEDMISSGKVREANFNEIVVVQELILVDKFVSKGIQKPKVYPPEGGRYRLVLDCRPANALRLDNSKQVWVVDDLLFGKNKASETNEVKQSQRSALSQIESISRSKRKIFAKIDLKNAFYSCFITKQLSKIFGFRHRNRYYTFMVLPMGWFLSPLLFQDIVSYVLTYCLDKIPKVSVIHQQDDILIA